MGQQFPAAISSDWLHAGGALLSLSFSSGPSLSVTVRELNVAVLILSARLPATGPGLSFFGVSRCRRDILVVFTLSRCVLALLWCWWRICCTRERGGTTGGHWRLILKDSSPHMGERDSQRAQWGDGNRKIDVRRVWEHESSGIFNSYCLA